MSQLIKLIWDFRGPNAKQIAAHHVIHLNEFVASEKLKNSYASQEDATSMHSIAFLVTEKEHMNQLRARLKPHRGQLYNP